MSANQRPVPMIIDQSEAFVFVSHLSQRKDVELVHKARTEHERQPLIIGDVLK